MADLMQDGPQRNRVRYILALALMVGILLAGYLAFNVWDRVRALGSAQQDHAEWVFSQLEIDFLKLDGAVEQARSGDENDLANLRKRFDIFYSRTEVAERVQQSGDLTREIQKIQAVLDTQIPLIDGSDEALAAGVPALSEALDTVEDMPRNIGLASISFAAKAAEAERKEIAQLIEILLVIVVTVTIALLGAILRLSRQTITLNRASREVERNHSQLATMLRASLDAVMVLSVDGEIIDFNGSAEEVFSISRDHALGRSYIELLVPPKLRHRQRDNLAHFNATGKTRLAETGRHETEMIDGTGRIFPVELSVSLARSNDAPVFVTYIRDITDKLQKEQEIIRARDEALDAYQEKSRFFAMMSHEMRTPLNGILSAIHLLHDDKLDAEQRKYVEAALKSGDILLGHIDDVLAIERSEAETNDNELQASDMVALTAGMVNTMTPLAKTSDTRLHLDQDG
ncbi:histidine kinase dimerization/phospho-acceptor domain-containing protein, partial [uncultured Sulfitobacter sp.]